MNSISKRVNTVITRRYALAILGFFAALLMGLGGRAIAQSEARIVTIYDNGQVRTVPADVIPVGDLLKNAGISLAEQDVVEPGLDTLILQQSFNINIYRARPVTITDQNGARKTVTTGFQSPKKIAEAAGITVYPEDTYSTGLVTNIVADQTIGETIQITRAKLVNLNLFGSAVGVRTQAATVEEFLDERNIEVSSAKQVLPELSTKVTEGMTVFIVQDGAKISLIEEDIPFKTRSVPDSNLPNGEKKVQQKGTNGKKVTTYEVVMVGGKETRGRLLQEIIITNPTEQVELTGVLKSEQVVGSNGELLLKLRTCETGGRYATNTGNGYYGAYQFSAGTWRGFNTGYAFANEAPPEVQDATALALARRSSFWTQFPGCSRKLGLPQYPY